MNNPNGPRVPVFGMIESVSWRIGIGRPIFQNETVLLPKREQESFTAGN
jgi:hypothetical protein